MRSTLLISILLLLGCHKEVAKKSYLLQLNFDSGGVSKSEGVIYEKDKKYKHDGYKSYVILGNKNAMIFDSEDGLSFWIFKTPEEKLIAEVSYFFSVDNASFANDATANCYGSLELEGAYTRSGRKIKVENGTFKFTWSNAEDYGQVDQVLTGTWTLQRK